MKAIPNNKYILIQAATGAGKTIIFCELIKLLLAKWPALRVCVLAHRRELITQTNDKLLKVWPKAPISIACATTGEEVNVNASIVIGSIQTLSKRILETAIFDLIFIDEAHRVPPGNKKSLYGKWLKAMNDINRHVVVLGFTATPFRLGHGYIYGSKCKPKITNYFNDLTYSINIKTLQSQGYLCPFIAKEVENIISDLKKVHVSGDYNQGELSTVMSKKIHVESAVKAIEKYASSRKRIIVFAVTIGHAETLVKAFRKKNYVADVIHSKMDLRKRDLRLNLFNKGQLRILVNVGILTEGYDSPAIDCVLLCRPTMSPSFFVQMIGRGLRPYEDKNDVLILDLSNNFTTHGDPDRPMVIIPGKKRLNPQPVYKVCPSCFNLIAIASKTCPGCNYEYPQEEIHQNGSPLMRSVVFNKIESVSIVNVIEADFDHYASRKGNHMARLSLVCQSDQSIGNIYVNEYFDFDCEGSRYGLKMAQKKWLSWFSKDAPLSVYEAVQRKSEVLFSIPESIEIRQERGFWKIITFGLKPWNENRQSYVDDIPF